MKIKEQTRQTSRRIVDTSDAVSSKLAVGCSKHCFEVVIQLTWFEEIFEEYCLQCDYACQ
ncbi:hypothetical protein [Streptococcus pneumoniae]|uniref:hypothetical protein n=1 Tax=Streptococcus pneumoniae TaxID=1313 RepID=UPI000B58BB0B|nr:hypothetical protein [Streptococcus pneumoniae]